jgi:hypothetical protein
MNKYNTLVCVHTNNNPGEFNEVNVCEATNISESNHIIKILF